MNPSLSMPPLAGRVAAFLVISILLHGFLFHNSTWRSTVIRLPHADVAPVLVKVGLESIGRDSKEFFNSQLMHAYNTLGPSVIDLLLVPLATRDDVSISETTNLNESHYQRRRPSPPPARNATQCSSNRTIACDINIYEQCVVFKVYPSPMRYLPFLQCVYDTIDSGDVIRDSNKNDEEFDHQWDTRTVIENCADRIELDGDMITACHDDVAQVVRVQKQAIRVTPMSVFHRPINAPWVEIDGTRIDQVDTTANDWLLQQICHAYTTKGGAHSACSTSLQV